MEYEAAFFDLDNTIYPYRPCHEAGTRSALEAFREHGYDIDDATFDELYDEARRDAKRELRGKAASHDRHLYFQRALRIHDDVHDAGAALAIGDAYWSGYMDRMEPFAGVEPTLERVDSAGLSVVVITNLTTRVQLEKLSRLGIDDHIDRLVTSEGVGREKPSALPFTTALAALDLRPSDAFMVGDNPAADIAGANAIGVDSVLFNADREGRLHGPERPWRRIESFDEVADIAGVAA